MRIGIDVRCLVEGRHTGIEEYTVNFLKNLFELDPKNEYVLFLNSWKDPRADFSWIKKYGNVTVRRFCFPNKLLNLSFWYLGWPKIDKLIGGADIFFMPNIIFGGVSKEAKLIATIHDLSFERYPETFSLKRRLWHSFVNPKRFVSRTDKIIAVSHSTKNDLVSLYGTDPGKISVIHSGRDEKFQPIDRNDDRLIRTKEKYGLPYKFILYLGTIEPRKNIVGMIRAYDQLQKHAEKNKIEELKKYKLVIAGHKGWLSGEIFEEIEKSKFAKSMQFIDFVDENDKASLFNLASIFVYPSFFEGFGFPPLEAMGCGVPVVASNNSSIPEIISQAGIMITPDKPDEIFKSMKEILLSKSLQEKLREKGIRRSAEFTWKKTAQKFLKLVNHL